MLLYLSTLAAAVACSDPTYSVDLRHALDVAGDMGETGDPARLEAAVREVRQVLLCLREAVPADVVEELHHVHGGQLLSEGRVDEALPYLVAGEVPEGSVDADVGRAMKMWQVGRGPRLPPPLRGRLLVDGQAADLRPATRSPYLLQHMIGDRVASTAYVLPGDSPPPYPRLRRYLVIAGGVSAALAIGGALGARQQRQQLFKDQSVPYTVSQLESLKARNHRLAIGAVGAGTLSLVGFGVFGMSFVW